MSSSPPPRRPIGRPAPVRRRSRKILFLLTTLGLLGAALWYFVLRTPTEKHQGPALLPQAALQRYEDERPLMATTFRMVIYSPNEEKARAAMEAAFARAEEIATICSDYDEESELSRLSAAPAGQEVIVSETLATVLAHARVTAELTDGAFDPTLGPLTQLWRRSRELSALPTGDELTRALELTGWEHLSVNLTRRTVTLAQPGMRLDLGGIAKGFAADEMYSVFLQHGLPRALIAAGGDVRVGQPPPGKTAWKVGLRTLGADTEDFIHVANCAVSTSGDLHQFIEIDGTRYSHIIDPSTGLGLTRRIAATVVAPLAVQSDPYATFACVLPEVAFSSFDIGEISLRLVTERAASRRDQQTSNFPRIDAL